MRRILIKLSRWSTAWGLVAVFCCQSNMHAEDGVKVVPASEPVVSAEQEPAVKQKSEEAAPVTKPRKLFQHATYPAAWKAAQQSNRPILVYVSMPNCHYCVKMKERVFQLPRVKKLVSNSFETVRADRYTHPKLVKSLRVKWYPTTVLVGPNNRILDVIEGYADANKFQQRLHTGLASVKDTPSGTKTR